MEVQARARRERARRPAPAHRAGRKPLHEQQYASSHSAVGDVMTGKAVGSPLKRGPKKVSGAREAGSEMHRLLYDGEKLAEMDQLAVCSAPAALGHLRLQASTVDTVFTRVASNRAP